MMLHSPQENAKSLWKIGLFNPRLNPLHGIREIRYNAFGCLYWKGIYLETLAEPAHPEHYEHVQHLGSVCARLERLGVPINARTVYSHNRWFADMSPDEPYKGLLSRCPTIRLASGKIILIFQKAASEFDGKKWHHVILPRKHSRLWQEQWSLSGLEQRGYGNIPLTQSDLDGVIHCLKHYHVPENLLTVMADALHPGRASRCQNSPTPHHASRENRG